jgi:tRNA modification GTPase
MSAQASVAAGHSTAIAIAAATGDLVVAEKQMNQELERDTIVAIATPPGRGGIGIVRISGASALACARALLGSADTALLPNKARLCTLRDPDTHTKLDEALVTYFAAGRSYTGEVVVEIAAHGSPVLLDHLLRLLLARGARFAQPGEFTERAFLSGRLDLTQAEAVRDLIDAQTLLGAQVAAQQLGGALAHTVAPLKAELIALIATLEAGIDFAEDDTPVASNDELARRLAALHSSLFTLERSFQQGRLITQGVTLAIVGRPNAGKSSLFNRLLARERAIVTAEPGTTRDTVQERLSLGGVPVELVDTAGLREAANEAERIGIVRSREAFADAGLVVLVLDATQPLNEEELALLDGARGRPLFVAFNKADLLPKPGMLSSAGHSSGKPGLIPAMAQVHALAPSATLRLTSAHTGHGVDALRSAMAASLAGEGRVAPESAMLTTLRQHTAVAASLAALERAQAGAAEKAPHEMLLLDLYCGLEALDSLTGTTTPDDILNLIFSTFCIGK